MSDHPTQTVERQLASSVTTPTLEPENIPAEIKQRHQWVVWKYETRDGKPTKVLYKSARPYSMADSTDPTTWSTYDAALKCHQTGKHNTAGIGYVFSKDDPYTGVDLDECLINGVMVDEAQQIIDDLDTYTEISPSGKGVKLLLRASKPGKHCRIKRDTFKEIEIYDRGRFFTITGCDLNGNTIQDRQDELDLLYKNLWPDKTDEPSKPATGSGFNGDDDDLIGKARTSKSGERFVDLYDLGNLSRYDNDASSADLSLCGTLAFYAGPDPERIDKLFRESALYRDKWDEKRGEQTYGERTIAEALKDKAEFYTGPQADTPAESDAPSSDAASKPAKSDEPKYLTGKGLIDAFNSGLAGGFSFHTYNLAPLLNPPGHHAECPLIVGQGFVTLLGGQPGAGKSAISEQVVWYILKTDPKARVFFANVELTSEVLLARHMTRLTGIETKNILTGQLNENERDKVQQHFDRLAPLLDRVAIYPNPRNWPDVAGAIRHFDANVVVADYLQRFKGGEQSQSLREDVGVVMQSLRACADGGRAVLAVSALSRSKTSSGSGYAASDGIASFRESSEVEYGADFAYIIANTEHPSTKRLHCVKNRYGRLGTYGASFDGERGEWKIGANLEGGA